MKRYILSFVLFCVFCALFCPPAIADDLKKVFNEAQRDFRRGNYADALTLWTRVIEPRPDDTNAESIDLSIVYFNRGLTYKRLLTWDKAADDFSMVLGFSPSDPDALYQRGGCYNEMGLPDKALDDLARACEISDEYCTEKQLEEKYKKDQKRKIDR